MRTISFSNPEEGSVKYPNNIAFMYSRQPVIVTCVQATSVSITVTCDSNGGKSHTETRSLYDEKAEFDISRIMQALARDVDGVLERISYEGSASLAEVFSLRVDVDDTIVLDLKSDIQALYGALDAAEVYGRHITQRVFANYPQTINLWEDILGNCGATFDGIIGQPHGTVETKCYETPLTEIIGDRVMEKLRGGADVTGETTWLYRIQEGAQTAQASRSMTLKGDASPRGRGVYLRWLNRQGSVSYWLFDKTQLETTGAVTESFSRFYSGDPNEPVGGVFRNPDKRNYDETRRLGLSAANLSEEEFDELCTLLTSPVVEMFYEAEEYTGLGFVIDGGTAATTGQSLVDGADAGSNLSGLDGGNAQPSALYHASEDRWIRVNVEGGTQARRNRYASPRLHTFETAITLIDRNNAKL